MICAMATIYEFNINIDYHTLPEKKNVSCRVGIHISPVLHPVEKPSQIETETKGSAKAGYWCHCPTAALTVSRLQFTPEVKSLKALESLSSPTSL